MNNPNYNLSVFEAWPEVKADMIVQVKKKLSSNTLDPIGIMHAKSLLRDLEKS